jgi:hypothetical protein
MFPHMVEFVRKAAEGFNFVELTSDQAAWHEEPVALAGFSL